MDRLNYIASRVLEQARRERRQRRLRELAAAYLWDAYTTFGINSRAKAYALAIQNLYREANVPHWEYGPDSSDYADAAWLLECRL